MSEYTFENTSGSISSMAWVNKNGTNLFLINFHKSSVTDIENYKKKILYALNGGSKLGVDKLHTVISCLCDEEPNTPSVREMLQNRIKEIGGEL